MSILRFALSSLVIASLFSSSPALATMEDPSASPTPMPSASPDDGRPPDALAGYCGNSVVDVPEECDEGENNGMPGCLCGSDCRSTTASAEASSSPTMP